MIHTPRNRRADPSIRAMLPGSRGGASAKAGLGFRPNAFTLIVASAFALPLNAQVLPTNPTVVNGAASFQQSGKTLTVTNTPGAVINWQSFSIGAGATTSFVQQNSASMVFNRVTGNDPSMILGNLRSNGQVFLINPNGITIGAGARIDTAAFVASSLGISNTDLLAGKFKFTGGPGTGNVVNQGTIVTQNGGYVYFIGKNVENSGVIHTPQGQIVLAAGNSVEIINPQSPDLRVEITAGANEAVNLGKLVASGGTIGMFAGNVRQKGIVSASTAEVNAQGKIVFVAKKDVELAAGSRTEANGPNGGSITIQAQGGIATVEGTVEAKGTSTPVLETGLPTFNSGIAAQNTITVSLNGAGNGQQAGNPQPVFVTATPAAVPAAPVSAPVAATTPELTGGTIQILGQGVNLTGNASIDASGEKGGGTILIGGDYQGANADVQNALRTYVGSNVSLRADALWEGNGGKVVVWADEATHFVGSLSALGGLNGGDGGLGEVSGKQYLYFRPAHVSLAARRAGYRSGTLLLDPSDVTLTRDTNAGFQTSGGAFTGGTFSPGNFSASTIDIEEIESILNTTNVIITSSGGTGTGLGSITLAANQSITNNSGSTRTLRLQAYGDIVLESGSSINGAAGALNVNLTAGTSGSGTITTQAGSSINSSGGSVNMTGVGAINLSGSINTAGGGVMVISTGAGIVLGSSINAGSGSMSLISSLGGITQTAGTLTSSGNFLAQGVTGIVLTQSNALSGGINFSGASASLTNSGAVAFAGSNLSGALTVNAGGNITQTGALIAGSTTLDAGGNDITLTNSANNFTTLIANGANVDVRDTNAVILGASTVTGNLNVTAGGAITQSGTLLVSGAGKTATFIATGNDITLTNSANNFTTLIANGANVDVRDTNAVILGASTVSGNLNVTAGGAITQSGTLLVSGAGKTATFIAAGNDITLTDNANNFTTLIANGANVDVRDADSVILGALTVTGNLNVTALAGSLTVSNSITAATGSVNLSGNTGISQTGGTINAGGTLGLTAATGGVSQSGSANITATGVTTVAAGAGNISLNATGNNFSTVAASGAAITLVDSNGIILGATTASSTLNVTALNGGISQSGAVNVTGAATFLASGIGNNISLGGAGSRFLSTITASGADITIVSGPGNFDDITLGNTTATGNLSVTSGDSGGNVEQSAGTAITVSGTATLSAPVGNVAMNNTGNNFNTVSASTVGGSITLVDSDSIVLSSINGGGGGSLNVTARNGSITQSGAVNIFNVISLVAQGSGNNINLNRTDNAIDTVSSVSGGAVTLVDSTGGLRLINITASGGLNVSTVDGNLTGLSGGSINVTGNATLVANTTTTSKNINLSGSVTVSGNLNLTAQNNITQVATGPVNVTGTTTLSAGGAISLTAAGNNFGAINAAAGAGLSLVNSGAIALGTIAAGTNLNVTALAGGITQSGDVIAASGTTTLRAANNAINLNRTGNNFGTVNLTAGSATLVDTDGIVLGAITTTGNLNVTAAANGSGTITQDASGISVGGNLVVNIAGNLGVGDVDISTGSTGTLTIVGGSKVAGNFNINAGGHSVNFGSTVDVGGNFTVVGASAGLVNASNLRAVGGTPDTATNVTASGADGSTYNLTQAQIDNSKANGGSVLGVSLTRTTHAATNATSGNAIVLTGPNTVGGSLTVNTRDPGVSVSSTQTYNLGQDPALNLSGMAITILGGAANGNVTLNDVGNTGNVSFVLTGTRTTNLRTAGVLNVSGNTLSDLTVTGGTVNFNNLSVTGALGATATGDITQTGSTALTVSGLTTLDGGALGNVNLGQSGNNFGTVTVTNANGVTLVDADALNLGGVTAQGAVNATALGGLLTVSNSIATPGAINLSGSTGISQTAGTVNAVSYTHLTLPTILRV